MLVLLPEIIRSQTSWGPPTTSQSLLLGHMSVCVCVCDTEKAGLKDRNHTSKPNLFWSTMTSFLKQVLSCLIRPTWHTIMITHWPLNKPTLCTGVLYSFYFIGFTMLRNIQSSVLSGSLIFFLLLAIFIIQRWGCKMLVCSHPRETKIAFWPLQLVFSNVWFDIPATTIFEQFDV